MGGFLSAFLRSEVGFIEDMIREFRRTVESGEWTLFLTRNESFWQMASNVLHNPQSLTDLRGYFAAILNEDWSGIGSGPALLLDLLAPRWSLERRTVLLQLLRLPTVMRVLQSSAFWELALDRKFIYAVSTLCHKIALPAHELAANRTTHAIQWIQSARFVYACVMPRLWGLLSGSVIPTSTVTTIATATASASAAPITAVGVSDQKHANGSSTRRRSGSGSGSGGGGGNGNGGSASFEPQLTVSFLIRSACEDLIRVSALLHSVDRHTARPYFHTIHASPLPPAPPLAAAAAPQSKAQKKPPATALPPPPSPPPPAVALPLSESGFLSAFWFHVLQTLTAFMSGPISAAAVASQPPSPPAPSAIVSLLSSDRFIAAFVNPQFANKMFDLAVSSYCRTHALSSPNELPPFIYPLAAIAPATAPAATTSAPAPAAPSAAAIRAPLPVPTPSSAGVNHSLIVAETTLEMLRWPEIQLLFDILNKPARAATPTGTAAVAATAVTPFLPPVGWLIWSDAAHALYNSGLYPLLRSSTHAPLLFGVGFERLFAVATGAAPLQSYVPSSAAVAVAVSLTISAAYHLSASAALMHAFCPLIFDIELYRSVVRWRIAAAAEPLPAARQRRRRRFRTSARSTDAPPAVAGTPFEIPAVQRLLSLVAVHITSIAGCCAAAIDSLSPLWRAPFAVNPLPALPIPVVPNSTKSGAAAATGKTAPAPPPPSLPTADSVVPALPPPIRHSERDRLSEEWAFVTRFVAHVRSLCDRITESNPTVRTNGTAAFNPIAVLTNAMCQPTVLAAVWRLLAEAEDSAAAAAAVGTTADSKGGDYAERGSDAARQIVAFRHIKAFLSSEAIIEFVAGESGAGTAPLRLWTLLLAEPNFLPAVTTLLIDPSPLAIARLFELIATPESPLRAVLCELGVHFDGVFSRDNVHRIVEVIACLIASPASSTATAAPPAPAPPSLFSAGGFVLQLQTNPALIAQCVALLRVLLQPPVLAAAARMIQLIVSAERTIRADNTSASSTESDRQRQILSLCEIMRDASNAGLVSACFTHRIATAQIVSTIAACSLWPSLPPPETASPPASATASGDSMEARRRNQLQLLNDVLTAVTSHCHASVTPTAAERKANVNGGSGGGAAVRRSRLWLLDTTQLVLDGLILHASRIAIVPPTHLSSKAQPPQSPAHAIVVPRAPAVVVPTPPRPLPPPESKPPLPADNKPAAPQRRVFRSLPLFDDEKDSAPIKPVSSILPAATPAVPLSSSAPNNGGGGSGSGSTSLSIPLHECGLIEFCDLLLSDRFCRLIFMELPSFYALITDASLHALLLDGSGGGTRFAGDTAAAAADSTWKRFYTSNLAKFGNLMASAALKSQFQRLLRLQKIVSHSRVRTHLSDLHKSHAPELITELLRRLLTFYRSASGRALVQSALYAIKTSSTAWDQPTQQSTASGPAHATSTAAAAAVTAGQRRVARLERLERTERIERLLETILLAETEAERSHATTPAAIALTAISDISRTATATSSGAGAADSMDASSILDWALDTRSWAAVLDPTTIDTIASGRILQFLTRSVSATVPAAFKRATAGTAVTTDAAGPPPAAAAAPTKWGGKLVFAIGTARDRVRARMGDHKLAPQPPAPANAFWADESPPADGSGTTASAPAVSAAGVAPPQLMRTAQALMWLITQITDIMQSPSPAASTAGGRTANSRSPLILSRL